MRYPFTASARSIPSGSAVREAASAAIAAGLLRYTFASLKQGSAISPIFSSSGVSKSEHNPKPSCSASTPRASSTACASCFFSFSIQFNTPLSGTRRGMPYFLDYTISRLPLQAGKIRRGTGLTSPPHGKSAGPGRTFLLGRETRRSKRNSRNSRTAGRDRFVSGISLKNAGSAAFLSGEKACQKNRPRRLR